MLSKINLIFFLHYKTQELIKLIKMNFYIKKNIFILLRDVKVYTVYFALKNELINFYLTVTFKKFYYFYLLLPLLILSILV